MAHAWKSILSAAVVAATPAEAQLSRTALHGGTFAITNATVVTMRGDSVLRDATLLVRDGRVAAVGSAARVSVPSSAVRVDGRGKWVIPGLADMHAHLYADEWVPDSVAPHELGVYLAHGVTTARIMIGTPLHLRLRREIEAGRLAGPQLWVASPHLSGDSSANVRVVRTPDAARAAVREVAAAGYDFVKLTTNIGPEVYDAVVDEARARRIRVVGHVDPRVGVARALAARQQIEHLDAYMESVLADTAPSRASVSDVGVWRVRQWETLDHVDDRKVEAIAGATARAGVPVTPTLAFFRLFFATPHDHAAAEARPDYAHIPSRMRELYERGIHRFWQNPPSEARRARYVAVRNRMTKAIIDSGGSVMAGSDAPGGLMGYGWSMHRELETLVAAGLTPMQALAAATVNPARFVGAAREWGSIAPGLRADLVLLDGDPLDDIRNTTRIAGVAVGGRWLARPELDAMVSRARVRLNPPSDTIRIDVGSEVVDGRVYRPHAARVRVYTDAGGTTPVAEWTNELTIGDSAGRAVMRWVTKGTSRAAGGQPTQWELRQTYDARTLAPLGYHRTSSAGSEVRLVIDGKSVRGTRRATASAEPVPVDATVERPGFFAGASDLVPLAVGLKPGSVMIAPVWSPGMQSSELRIFTVVGKVPVTVEGQSIEAWKVEERRHADRTLASTWWLLDRSPYMVYGETTGANGELRRMTEVEITP